MISRHFLKEYFPKKAYLCQSVVHDLRLEVVFAQNSKEPEDLDLEKRVGDAVDVMLRGVAGHVQVLEDSDQGVDALFEVVSYVCVFLSHLSDERDPRDQDPVVLLAQHSPGGGKKLLHQLGIFVDQLYPTKQGLLFQVRI